MIDIKSLFEKFSNANFFSRVDNIHILELHIGLDEKGRKAIEFRGKFTPRKVSGTSAIEVNQYTRPDYNTIRFSLCDEEVSGLFYKFCEDLVEQTRDVKDRSEGYTAIVNRYFQWKKMFVSSKGNLLTEPEIMGLIGEILYLKGTLAERIGLYNALKSWSGQELTHKDFSFDDTWVEVKTVRSGGQTVKISSLEQLDSEYDGELAVFSLEKMSMATPPAFSAHLERNQVCQRNFIRGFLYGWGDILGRQARKSFSDLISLITADFIYILIIQVVILIAL